MHAETLTIRRRDAEERARRSLMNVARELGEMADEPPRVGDLLALPIGGGAGIEWLVGARPEPATVRLIPVDGGPWIGDQDVALDPTSTAGPCVARGAHATDVPADRLASTQRVGRVSADDLERILARVEQGSGDPTAIEVATDPAYRAWIEDRLRPAIEDLRSLPVVLVPKAAPPAVRPMATSGPWLALAASVVLAVLATWTVARWEVASDPGGEVALAVFMPTTDALRTTEALVVERPPGAEQIVLALRTLTPVPYPTYRVELVDLDAPQSEPLWSTDALHLQGASDVVVRVPVATLTARRVEARLFGRSDDGTTEPLERWSFRIVDRAPD